MRYLTFALTKGRLAKKTMELLEQLGITCEEIQDKEFQIWSKGKILKKCPRCQIY